MSLSFDPLIPNTDGHLISPVNIIPESNIMVMRIKKTLAVTVTEA